MPTADQVIVELEARTSAHDGAVRSSADQFDQSMSKIEGAMKRTENTVESSSDGIKRAIHELSAELAGAFAVEKLVEYADEYTRFTNALTVAGLAGQELISTQRELISIANQNGVSIEAVSNLYRQLGIAGAQLGTSTADNAKITAGFAAAMRIQGTSAQTAQYATLEFGHALEETRVQARAFNALQFEMPVVLQAIARNMEGTGGSVAGLRREILAGKVSNKDFADAFLASSDELQKRAQSVNLTIGSSIEVLKNNLIAYVGVAGQTSGVTATVSGAIQALGNNLNTVVPAVEVLAAAIGIRYVAGLAKAEGSLLNVTIAQAKHIAGVAAGNRALNEAAEAELTVARAAKMAAEDEAAASTAVVTAIETRVIALREEAAQYAANIRLAEEARAAAIREAPNARANAAAGFGNVIVGAGAASRSAPDRAGEAANTTEVNRQQLARTTGELTAAEDALAAAQLRAAAASEATLVATTAYTGALEATTVAATLTAGAVGLIETALAFVGGPVGAIVLGLVAGIIALGSASSESAKGLQEAEQRASDFANRVQEATGKGTEFAAAVDRLTSAQNDTATAAGKAASAFRDQAVAAGLAERAVASLTAQERQKRLDEIDRDNARARGQLDSTFGVDFRTGNITGSGGLKNNERSTGSAFLRSLGYNGAVPGAATQGIIANAQANRGNLDERQQAALVKYEAALDARSAAERTITQNTLERAAILKSPAFQALPGAKKGGGGDRGPGEKELVDAEEKARIAQAGPDKRAAILAEEQANYLKERARLVKDADPAAIPALDAQARKYASDLKDAQLKSLAARGGGRAANRESSEERATTRAVAQAADQEAKAREQSAAAAVQRAQAALSAAAGDATATEEERNARVATAAAALATAQASQGRLANEIARIEVAAQAKIDETNDNNRLSAARKAQIVAAETRARDAQVQAARDADAARRAAADTAGRGAGSTLQQGSLESVAGADGIPVAQRVAAEQVLLAIQHAEARSRLETILSQDGVTAATKELARNALAQSQALGPQLTAAAQTRDFAQQNLRSIADLARTQADRREAEAALLRITQGQRDAATEVLISQLDASDASKELAAKLRASVVALSASEAEALRRRNLPALQAFSQNQPQNNQERRDAAEGAAARDLSSLSSELVSVAQRTETFGEALNKVGTSIVGQIEKALIDRALAPLTGLISGGLDQIFGTAATSGKVSADIAAATAATALAAAATAAAAALAGVAATGAASSVGQLGVSAGQIGPGIANLFGGGLATGGEARPGFSYEINENGKEILTPRGGSVSVTPASMVGAARTADAAPPAVARGPVNLHNYGEPMSVERSERSDGGMELTLKPLGRAVLKSAGESGELLRGLKRSPPPKDRG